jgi:glutathione S-transferase
MPVISRGALRALRFPGSTVPALRLDGRRIQGSREIAHALDELVPEPPLYPADPAERAAVEQAERWGEEELQPAIRRIFWYAMGPDHSPLRSYSEGAKLRVPIGLAVKTAAPIVAAESRLNKASDENVRADLAALPGMLQRIDDWIAEGVLGGDPPNAADLQIATSIRLAMTLDDLRLAIAGRPVGEHALRLVPDFPGETPPVLPAPWLEPLKAPVAA